MHSYARKVTTIVNTVTSILILIALWQATQGFQDLGPIVRAVLQWISAF